MEHRGQGEASHLKNCLRFACREVLYSEIIETYHNKSRVGVAQTNTIQPTIVYEWPPNHDLEQRSSNQRPLCAGKDVPWTKHSVLCSSNHTASHLKTCVCMEIWVHGMLGQWNSECSNVAQFQFKQQYSIQAPPKNGKLCSHRGCTSQGTRSGPRAQVWSVFPRK